ncbi:PX domain protein, partial [Ichthyophthirius multifiliis]
IQVYISEAVQREGLKYFTYGVTGQDKDGKFEVYRRYSDFYHFRQLLVSLWPGCFIPPLPSKKVIGNKETRFLEDRRKFLQYFMVKLSNLPYLWYSEEIKQFIRNNNNQDFEKIITNMPKQSNDDIINKYKTTFSYLSGKEINGELNMKILTFKNFLKVAVSNLKKMKCFCRQLSLSKEKFDQQFNLVSTKILPEYEMQSILEYAQKNENYLIFNNNQILSNNLIEIQDQSKQNEFEIITDMIRMELKEVEAFLEILQQKEDLEEKKNKSQIKVKSEQAEQSKLQAGKTTFKSLFSTGSKEDKVQKLEKSIEETQHELDNYSLLVDLVTIIIGYILQCFKYSF